MLILFDCDGVLVDSEIIGNRVLAALLSANGYPITAAQSPVCAARKHRTAQALPLVRVHHRRLHPLMRKRVRTLKRSGL